MIMDSDPLTLQYLSMNQCSDDIILNQSFIKMNDYFESMRLKNWIVVGFLGLLIGSDILLSLLNMIGRY